MQNILSSNDVSLNFSCLLGRDILIADAMDGVEEISKPFSYKLIVHSLEKEINCNKLLGTEASLSLTLGEKTRDFSGIIGSINQLETREGSDGLLYVFYELHLHPKLWLLTFTKDYRIFQNQYVSDIVTQVLQENGVTQIDNRASNAGKSKREFCVQYDESCFDFISRLMEEEGIAYSFTHQFGQHTLVLMDQNNDGNKAYTNLPMSQSVLSNTPALNQITFLRRQHTVVASHYRASNYNYMAPSMPLRSSISGDGIGGTIYEYPASFNDLKTSEQIASLRINEIEWPHHTVHGKSTAPLLSEASVFKLSNHPSDDANITYFVYAITHKITRIPVHEIQSDMTHNSHLDNRKKFLQHPNSNTPFQTIYDNNFSAVPNNVIFTPLRKTKKPKIHSNQTAVVVGPPGEEVYCDNLGRIKVQFHWDTRGTFDTNSSCWVRVSQNWASAGWGSLVIPRVGMEVIVTFIDGNPDMPLVIGCVYNGDNSPPTSVVTNPTVSTFKTNSTRSNAHFNELSIDDEKGMERISVKAAKDMDISIAENYALMIQNGDCSTVLAQGNLNTLVKQGNKGLTLVAGDYIINLENGELTIKASGDISIAAGGTLSLSGKNINLNARNSINLAAPNSIDISGGTVVTVDFPGKLPTFPMDSSFVAASQAQALASALSEKEVTDKIAAEKAEADKIAAAKAEADRITAAKAEADRITAAKAEADIITAAKAEADRITAAKAEADRITAAKAEADRIAAAKAEADRIATEKAEADRIAAAKAEADRIATEKAEADRIAAAKAEADRIATEKAKADRIAAAKAEADRIATEKAEADRLSALAAAQTAAKAEADRIAKEKAEADRIATAKAEADKIAAEKTKTSTQQNPVKKIIKSIKNLFKK